MNMTEVKVWKAADQLVMCRDTDLPYRCVKTNAPAAQHVTVRLRAEWNPLFWGIFYLLFAKRITLKVPLSQPVVDKSQRWCRISKRMLIGGVAAVFVLIGLGVIWFELLKMDANEPTLAVFTILPMGAILVATAGPVIWTHWRTFGLVAKRITKTHVWIGGVNKDYLMSLPDWPEKQ